MKNTRAPIGDYKQSGHKAVFKAGYKKAPTGLWVHSSNAQEEVGW